MASPKAVEGGKRGSRGLKAHHTTTRQTRLPTRWRLLGWICAGHSLSHFWTLALPPLFPALAAHFGVTYLQLGLLVGAYSLTFGLFQLPSGYLVDRFGAKPVLVGGLLLNGSALALYGLAPGYPALLGLALLAGIGKSVFHPADYAILSAAFSRERSGRPYSLHTFSGFAGSAAAPVTVAGLHQLLGWQMALAIAGLVGVGLAFLLVWRLQVPDLGLPSPGGRPFFLLSRPLVLMFIFYVFAAMVTSGLQSFLPATLNRLYGISLSSAGAVLTTYLVALAGGVLLGGAVADHVRHHARVVSSLFVGGMLLMLLVAVAHPPIWLLFPIFAAGGALHGIIMPSRDKLVRGAAPEGLAGKSFGFVSTGMSLGSVVAPSVLGMVLDANRPDLVFWAISVFMLAAASTTLAYRQNPGRQTTVQRK